jgi:hypothetical protein
MKQSPRASFLLFKSWAVMAFIVILAGLLFSAPNQTWAEHGKQNTINAACFAAQSRSKGAFKDWLTTYHSGSSGTPFTHGYSEIPLWKFLSRALVVFNPSDSMTATSSAGKHNAGLHNFATES